MRAFSSTVFFLFLFFEAKQQQCKFTFSKEQVDFSSCCIGGTTVGRPVFRESGKIKIFFSLAGTDFTNKQTYRWKWKMKSFFDFETYTRKSPGHWGISYDSLQLLSSLGVWNVNNTLCWFWFANVTMLCCSYRTMWFGPALTTHSLVHSQFGLTIAHVDLLMAAQA